jgi:uncharacterized repeat protein (TIGR01451 family)
MRARNTNAQTVDARWFDQVSGQGGPLTLVGQQDTFFAVANGSQRHTILLIVDGQTVSTKATSTTSCQGRLTITKTVAGPGPPGASWPIEIRGDNGFEQTVSVGAGGSATVTVPGTIGTGSVLQGQVPGGYTYAARELDTLGAVVTGPSGFVTVNSSASFTLPFTNTFGTTPPPQPPEPPGPFPPNPIIPPTPGAPTADLKLVKSIVPTRGRVGDVFTFTVRVTNRGPDAAVGVVGRDISAFADPNRVARVVSINQSQGSCTGVRPITCTLGDLAPGAVVTVVARARILSTQVLRNVADVTSSTADANPTNNRDAAGVRLSPARAAVALRKRADRRRVVPGGSVGYRLTVAGRGSGPASQVRVCDLLAHGLRVVTTTPRAAVSGGRACWQVDRLAKGRARRCAFASARARRSACGCLATSPSPPRASAPCRRPRPARPRAPGVHGVGGRRGERSMSIRSRATDWRMDRRAGPGPPRRR